MQSCRVSWDRELRIKLECVKVCSCRKICRSIIRRGPIHRVRVYSACARARANRGSLAAGDDAIDMIRVCFMNTIERIPFIDVGYLLHRAVCTAEKEKTGGDRAGWKQFGKR